MNDREVLKSRSNRRRRQMPAAMAPTLTVNNGVEMPALGFGVFQTRPRRRSAPSRRRSARAIGWSIPRPRT
jgi:hypothetical protein